MELTIPEEGMSQPELGSIDWIMRLTGNGDVAENPASPPGATPTGTPAPEPVTAGAGGSGPSLADLLANNFYDSSSLGAMGDTRSAFGFAGAAAPGSTAQGDVSRLTPEEQQDLLARLRYYDPNASITTRQWQMGGDDAKDYTGSFLNYDVSKLPRPGNFYGKPVTPNQSWVTDMQSHGIDPSSVWNVPNVASTAEAHNGLLHPDYVWNDPVYGQLTDNRNIKAPAPGFWDYLGAFAPALLTTGANLLTGGALTPLQGAAMAGFNALGRGITGQGFNPLSTAVNMAAPFAGPLLGNALGIPSQLAQAGISAANAAANGAFSNNARTPTRTPQATVTTDPTGYDPSKFGGGMGSTPKPSKVDEQPVQNAFGGGDWGAWGANR